jgi:hypothetical protein
VIQSTKIYTILEIFYVKALKYNFENKFNLIYDSEEMSRIK